LPGGDRIVNIAGFQRSMAMARGRRGATLEEQVRLLAQRFADEVTRAVRDGLQQEVAAEVARVLRNATRHIDLQLPVSLGARDRRIGKLPVPVVCPVPRCPNRGIRAKNNFCAAHAASLSDGEKRSYRERVKRSKSSS
jgi:hypothetical protein